MKFLQNLFKKKYSLYNKGSMVGVIDNDFHSTINSLIKDQVKFFMVAYYYDSNSKDKITIDYISSNDTIIQQQIQFKVVSNSEISIDINTLNPYCLLPNIRYKYFLISELKYDNLSYILIDKIKNKEIVSSELRRILSVFIGEYHNTLPCNEDAILTFNF